MVDWDNANVIDLQTGETVLNSILVEPILRGKEVKGVLYLSRPINRKEYGFNELNFLSALGNVISGILSCRKLSNIPASLLHPKEEAEL